MLIYYLPSHDIGHFLLLFKEIHDIGKPVDRVFLDQPYDNEGLRHRGTCNYNQGGWVLYLLFIIIDTMAATN